MLTTIAIDPQNFDYDAFAIYIENNLEHISQTYQKETGYKITNMNITTSNSFVIVNYEREHATENRPKDHCFKFISTQLNYYHGPQLAGVDDVKWYSWEYELRNTVIGLAYEQINEIISTIAHKHPGITVDELIDRLYRKDPSC